MAKTIANLTIASLADAGIKRIHASMSARSDEVIELGTTNEPR